MKRIVLLVLSVFALSLSSSPSLLDAAGPSLPPQANLPNVFVCPALPAQARAPDPEARCHARVITDPSGTPQANVVPTGYGPADFRAAYGLPALSGASPAPTIAVVIAYDNPRAEQDLAVYSNTFGLPACTTANGCFKKVNQTGGTKYPKADAGWALESSLDVQVVHATCPNCKILLVEASTNSFSNLLAAEDYATANAQIINNSWGAGEFSSETSAAYDGHFNRPGRAITVSSGDNGFGAQYPAASQYVTAVGGTSLQVDTISSARVSETAWSGAGSGCSAYEPKPSWQAGLSACPRRLIADVSAVADPNTGAAVYDSTPYCTVGRAFCTSGWYQVGGTSLAAPLIAGVYGLAGNGATASFSYTNSGSLFDVMSGSNGSCAGSYLCTAGAGYDGPTGLGTPNGTGGF
jgi:subtilase family serine protease